MCQEDDVLFGNDDIVPGVQVRNIVADDGLMFAGHDADAALEGVIVRTEHTPAAAEMKHLIAATIGKNMREMRLEGRFPCQRAGGGNNRMSQTDAVQVYG